MAMRAGDRREENVPSPGDLPRTAAAAAAAAYFSACWNIHGPAVTGVLPATMIEFQAAFPWTCCGGWPGFFYRLAAHYRGLLSGIFTGWSDWLLSTHQVIPVASAPRGVEANFYRAALAPQIGWHAGWYGILSGVANALPRFFPVTGFYWLSSDFDLTRIL